VSDEISLIKRGTGGSFLGNDEPTNLFSIGTAGWNTPLVVSTPVLPPPATRRAGGGGGYHPEAPPTRWEPEEEPETTPALALSDEELEEVLSALIVTGWLRG